jgi:hypothetical protein
MDNEAVWPESSATPKLSHCPKRMMTPWFIATEKFDKSDDGWKKYIAWSGLEQLDEVVSLDSSSCPTVLPEIKPEYWTRIVNEDFMLQFFTDLEYLRGEIAGIQRTNLLCVFRNPPAHPTSEVPKGFEFVGYDLTDVETSTSALTNCGGFPDVFSNSELSQKGLLGSHERARQVQAGLRRLYPNEPHANCHLWAIFRST